MHAWLKLVSFVSYLDFAEVFISNLDRCLCERETDHVLLVNVAP